MLPETDDFLKANLRRDSAAALAKAEGKEVRTPIGNQRRRPAPSSFTYPHRMLVEAVSASGSNSKREYPMKALFRFFATVAIALTMGPAFFGQQRSTSEIHARINSIPTGADIKVDGTYVGTTPLEIELPCCFHDITISKRGFKPWTDRVRNNGHANVTAHLK